MKKKTWRKLGSGMRKLSTPEAPVALREVRLEVNLAVVVPLPTTRPVGNDEAEEPKEEVVEEGAGSDRVASASNRSCLRGRSS